MAQAGADAGVLAGAEHRVIENVIELDTRLVTSSMTARDACHPH
jgi:CBS domain containing-hemolysin-like protein